MMQFYKYQGAGNDFIIIDNRNGDFDIENQLLVEKLCDRRFGIGADGLMLLQDAKGYDFEMIYFNSDGRQGSMCGNGGRCIVAFAKSLGVFTDKTDFLATDGPHAAYLSAEGSIVRLQMIDVNEVNRDGEAYVLNTGSPHFVKLVRGLDDYDVIEEAKKIRFNTTYEKEGINVNFVEALAEGGFALRTYERGVEDETFACGTGATAVAMAMALQHKLFGQQSIGIRVMGGNLTIHFNREGNQFKEVYLEGPAQFVYSGQIDLAQFVD